jgi:UDP-2-acetamido-3-amino-2,3-dideoxy-glucuronate N-acetyltransferase
VRVFHELGALHTVCDVREGARLDVAARFPDVRVTGDIESVLGDASIPAVVIATPAETHVAVATAALCAGKDIFVEKPLALRSADAERLIDLARSRSRILMVGHLLRYHPVIWKLKELCVQGELGRIEYVYSNRLNLGKVRREENALWSFAPHDVSVLLHLFDSMPIQVSTTGGTYLQPNIADVTVSNLLFDNGARAHIFVSWLHPFKEQRLVVVGSEKMAVFDDTAEHKLVLYPHKVEWLNRVPTAVKAAGENVAIEDREPLRDECQHFLDCIRTRTSPVSNGEEGLSVLRVLDACQRALSGAPISLSAADVPAPKKDRPYFVHESAYVDEGAEIGEGSKIWHFSHVMKGARIGRRCVIGQNVNVDGGTVIGNNVKIQNNVSIYTGVVLEDDVFCGPSMVFTNVINPRSHVERKDEYRRTLVKRGASIGANATIVCGVTLGRYCVVGAGGVVTRDVPDYAVVYGNPARVRSWVCWCGVGLDLGGDDGATCEAACKACGRKYRREGRHVAEL